MHKWERRVRRLEAPAARGACAACRLRCMVICGDRDAPELRPSWRCPECGQRPKTPFKLILGATGAGV